MELSAHIRDVSRTLPNKHQLILAAFARALEIIPRQICENAGLDSTDVLNKLRMRHAIGRNSKDHSQLSENLWAGVDVDSDEGVRDNLSAFVWEPSLIKINAIGSACEAACLILSVDETVKNPQSEQVSKHTMEHIEPQPLIPIPNPSRILGLKHHQALLNELSAPGAAEEDHADNIQKKSIVLMYGYYQ
jgi:chaperonin GroEL (HSP60 family)